jgi:hypothetical protein
VHDLIVHPVAIEAEAHEGSGRLIEASFFDA